MIFENAYLTDDEKVRACQLSEAAGADFVKTSTGFAPTGATHEDLMLMRANTSPHIQVKAAGGVRTLDALLAVMCLGVTRIGATATKTILDDFRARKADAGAAACVDYHRCPGAGHLLDMPAGTATMDFIDEAQALLERITSTQADGHRDRRRNGAPMRSAADGLVHLFGTGHSRIPVEEMFPRYGSFPGFNPIVELSMTFHTQVVGANGQRQAMYIERKPGLAEVILSNFRFGPRDVMVVFSASGLTAVPVEMAARRPPPGVESHRRDERRAVDVRATRPGGGRRLLDEADLVIDLCTPEADALVTSLTDWTRQLGQALPSRP